LKSVTPGRDFGDAVEIVGGLDPHDRVILNPPDSIAANTLVRVTATAAPQ
jgi:hypothetical protein